MNILTTRSPSLERIERYLIAIGLTTAALWVLLPLPLYAVRGDLHGGYWGYNAAALALTYFDTGFARRELAGTLARFFTSDPMIAAAVLHILTTFALAAAMIVLVTRSPSTALRRIVLALAALVVLWRLMSYIGSVDALIMLLGLAAALAATKERWIAASVIIFIALLVHEVGVIVLVPLLTIVCIERGSWRSLLSRRGAVAAAIFVAALLLYFASLVSSGQFGEIARHVHDEIASSSGQDQAAIADIALYYTLSGTWGLRTVQCLIRSDPAYPLQFASVVFLTILFGLGLRSCKRWPSFLLTLGWVIGLSLIGADMGRWTTFALFSFLTVALLEDAPYPVGIKVPEVFLSLAAFLLMSIGLNVHANYFPIPLAEVLEHSHNFMSLGPGKTMEACDPGWLTRIGL